MVVVVVFVDCALMHACVFGSVNDCRDDGVVLGDFFCPCLFLRDRDTTTSIHDHHRYEDRLPSFRMTMKDDKEEEKDPKNAILDAILHVTTCQCQHESYLQAGFSPDASISSIKDKTLCRRSSRRPPHISIILLWTWQRFKNDSSDPSRGLS
jgi:hypothetical protein